MVEDPDIELIQEAQRGNKAAFGKLVDQYYSMVYAISYGVLNNREIARDVTQDVFLKAFKTIKKFEGRAKFKTWLHRISVNMAIDYVRRKKPVDSIDASEERATEDQGAPIVIEDLGDDPRQKASREELRVFMQEALQELSADHRAVLVLREWQNLSYEEIAESLGIETGTVMSRLFYARKKIAEILSRRLQGERL